MYIMSNDKMCCYEVEIYMVWIDSVDIGFSAN